MALTHHIQVNHIIKCFACTSFPIQITVFFKQVLIISHTVYVSKHHLCVQVSSQDGPVIKTNQLMKLNTRLGERANAQTKSYNNVLAIIRLSQAPATTKR